MPLKELNHSIGKLNKLDRPRKEEQSRNSLRVAFSNNVVSGCRRHGSWPVPGLACIKRLLAGRRHRRNIDSRTIAHAAIAARSTPDSGEIVRIEWQVRFGFGLVRLASRLDRKSTRLNSS